MKNTEAGEWVLGGILNNGDENFDRAKRILSAKDFLHPIHRQIFSAMEKLREESIPIDVSTVYSLLKEQSKEEGVELAKYLRDDVPTDKILDYWVREVKKQSLQVQIKEAVAAEDMDGVKLDVLVYELNHLRGGGFHYRALSEVPPRERVPIIPCGFGILDDNLPLAKGRVTVFAGKPGMGKTALGHQILFNVAKENCPVACVSMEMGEDDVSDRVLNSFGERPSNFFILDPPTISTSELKHICKTLNTEKGVQIFMLDFLQLMHELKEGKGKEFATRHLEVSFIIRRIKAIARELGVAFIVISSLRRGSDGEEPSLSHLKESGDIEFAADGVLFIHQPGKSKAEEKLFIVAKNRYGETGDFPVRWSGRRTRFFEEGTATGAQQNLYGETEDGSY